MLSDDLPTQTYRTFIDMKQGLNNENVCQI